MSTIDQLRYPLSSTIGPKAWVVVLLASSKLCRFPHMLPLYFVNNQPHYCSVCRQQVSEAIERCSQLVDYMYAAAPEERDPPDSDGEVRNTADLRALQRASLVCEQCSNALTSLGGIRSLRNTPCSCKGYRPGLVPSEACSASRNEVIIPNESILALQCRTTPRARARRFDILFIL